jgi:cardiolipin synthase
VELVIQPDHGVAPLLEAIHEARKSIDLVVFRFDRPEIEAALASAVRRGVRVRALIAHTNKGGERRLRELEQRFLDSGMSVVRTANDLVRYHGKHMIVDGTKLCVLGFNYTYLDIDKSRSFGIVTKNRKLVREALQLFEADVTRQRYRPHRGDFVVSPQNSRRRLTEFIQKARRQLLIYDPEVSDAAIIRVLEERIRAGVEVRLLGGLERKCAGLEVRDYPGKRLHVRAMIRDSRHAFVGSQSLRMLELDARREVGVIFRDRKVVRRLLAVFEGDWARTDLDESAGSEPEKIAAGMRRLR